jgi:hypothetical protein
MVIGVCANVMAKGTGENERNTLAIFPFDITPQNPENAKTYKSNAESIAQSLTRRIEREKAFNKIVAITPQTLQAINFEEKFQRSGYTDTDTVLEAGRKQNASHVLAGNIIRLAQNKYFVTASILDVKSLQQIAGYYTFVDSLKGIDAIIPAIAKELANGAKRKVIEFPGLAITPFKSAEIMSEDMARVITHIFSCKLTNGKQFAILPRTESVEKVQEEHNRQGSGITDETGRVELGRGQNAQCVLSIGAQNLDGIVKMGADVLDINDGTIIYGEEKEDPLTLIENIKTTAEYLAQKLESGAAQAKTKWDAANKYQAALKKAADDKKAKEDAARMELDSAKDSARNYQAKLLESEQQNTILQNEKTALQIELNREKDARNAEREQARKSASQADANLKTKTDELQQTRNQLDTATKERDTARQDLATATQQRDAANQRVTQTEAELDRLRGIIAQLQSNQTTTAQQLIAANQQRDTANQQVKTLTEQNTNAQNRVSELARNFQAKDADLRIAQGKLNDANQEINNLKEQFNNRITALENSSKGIIEQKEKTESDLAKEKALTKSLDEQLKEAQQKAKEWEAKAKEWETKFNAAQKE